MLTARMWRALAAKTNFQRATPTGRPIDTSLMTKDGDLMRSEPFRPISRA